MLDTGAMLAILTTITLNDYYTDQIQEKRQKLHTYARSMERIGDNVRIWGYTITSTLEKSGRTDLEQSILQGAQELPIYLFAQVIRRQSGGPTKYQKRIIDIAFQNLNMLPFSRSEYDQALHGKGRTLQNMEEMVDLSSTCCGNFWYQFLEVMDGATAGEEVIEDILAVYAQLLCDFSILGEGSIEPAQQLYERFTSGLQSLPLEVPERTRMLQFLLDHSPDDAPQIYANIDADANAYLAYYGLANDWEGPNFWAIHLIGATKDGCDHLSAEFVDHAGDFLRGTERLLRRNFSEYNFDGLAQSYHMEVIGKMMELVG